MTAPKIYDGPAVDHDCDGGADFTMLLEIARKRVANPGKAGIAFSFDLCIHRRLLDARPSTSSGLSNTQVTVKKSSPIEHPPRSE
jgi:hypothetical protein